VRAIVKLGKYHDIEVEDDVNAVLEYADGKVINFITSTGENPGINRLEIIGENGLLTLENDQLTFRRNAQSSSEFIIHANDMMLRLDCQTELVETASKDTLVNSGYPLLFENLLDAVKNQAKLIAPLKNCARSLELANAILYAGLKDEVVTLPLDAQKFSDLLDDLIRQAEK
jgi:predicted dehydrogenase